MSPSQRTPSGRNKSTGDPDDRRGQADDASGETQPMPVAVLLVFLVPLALLVLYGILGAH